MDRHAPTQQQQAPQQLAKEIALASKDGDNSLFAQLAGNPFFTAGFGLAGIAAVGRLGQKGVKYGTYYLRRHLLVDLEVTRLDDSYNWILRWISAHQRAQATGSSEAATRSRNANGGGILNSLVRRFSPRIHHLQIETHKASKSEAATHRHFAIVPGHGKHILRYRDAFIMVNRERKQGAFNTATGMPFETITLTTLYSQRNVFEQIFAEAHQLALQMQEGKTTIYQAKATGMEWEAFGEPKRKRPLSSVVLEEGVKERIVEDIKGFLETRTWYLDRGIPYRRGYLLYGPPGTGKSSFIYALAGELDFNIAMLNVSQRGLTDDKLQMLLTKLPARTFVLLEDADAAFVNRRTTEADGYNGQTVTFSGLLNALDGVASAEERIIFLTTNHVERLDEALIRPGRVDMTVRLGEATAWQIERLWERFYAEVDPDGAGRERFIQKVREAGLVKGISTAELQGLFVYNKDDAEGAIKAVEELVESRKQGL
ncbi:hypothetical protein K490DRAFT_74328 [Saccharata proteae CBS 121410]|uniref:Mitochondrial chaperone BCS1 n=1 Tax=Saccharata proteae CBS 121410 TaxID=1314787 RepID=A0A9P4HTT6_9PEZI|nr:hypothetical protein K490DRAFT_74328 [Saccharata proteae CBS 121410]